MLAALAVTLCGLTSRAQERSELRVVVLELRGSWPDELRKEVLRDLNANLGDRGLRWIEPRLLRSDLQPVGYVRLVAPTPESRRARIEFRDLAQGTEMERDIELSHHPEDTWGFVIAVSIDELLRALWTDLTEPPSPAVPEEVPRTAPDETPRSPKADRMLSVALGPAFELYTAGARLAGADGLVAARVHRHFGLELALGGRTLWPMAFDFGSVHARALVGEVGASTPLLPTERPLRLELVVAVRALRVAWRGVADEGFAGRDARANVISVRGGVRTRVALGQNFHLGLLTTAGSPLLRSVAADDMNTQRGIGGLELGTRLELGWP